LILYIFSKLLFIIFCRGHSFFGPERLWLLKIFQTVGDADGTVLPVGVPDTIWPYRIGQMRPSITGPAKKLPIFQGPKVDTAKAEKDACRTETN
jgi:hypothetical protein